MKNFTVQKQNIVLGLLLLVFQVLFGLSANYFGLENTITKIVNYLLLFMAASLVSLESFKAIFNIVTTLLSLPLIAKAKTVNDINVDFSIPAIIRNGNPEYRDSNKRPYPRIDISSAQKAK